MVRVPVIPGIIIVGLLVTGVFLAGCSSTAVLPQENGSVRILSSPSGAAVYLDGEYRGTTPATITAVTAGSHTLEIRANGYDRWQSPVLVDSGGIHNITATLFAIPVTSVPVTSAQVTVPPAHRGYPEIHIDGYWTYLPGESTTERPVPLIVHTEGFNVGDGDAREVTVSANLYYGGRQVCWRSVYLGTLKAGGHIATDTMVSCPLPSAVNRGDVSIRFENIVVTG